ncbi:hypothetical protein CYMTET_12686 [Cymbomonas tetramitiformis]|uniref:Uncharacterized protein n=1 Tax=Cymbomonas tetramitiformis TaxID=36881 RepID=A0AAE0GJY5_9CHLO|nr:hypothetical protein CYMTET_12686 [Cymbomonas tetramitiformis]
MRPQRVPEACCRHVLTAGAGALAATCPQLVPEAYRRHALIAGAGGLSAKCSQVMPEAWCRHVLTAGAGGLSPPRAHSGCRGPSRRHVPTAGAGGMVPPRAHSGCRGLVAATCPQLVPEAWCRHVLTAGTGGLSPPRAHSGWRRHGAATCSQRWRGPARRHVPTAGAGAFRRHVPTAGAGGMVPPRAHSGCRGLVAATCSQLVPEACRRHVLTAGTGGLSPPRAHSGWRRHGAATCSQRVPGAFSPPRAKAIQDVVAAGVTGSASLILTGDALAGAGGLSPPRARSSCWGLVAATCPQLVPEACRRHVPTAGAGGLSPPRAHSGCRRLVAATCSQRLAEAYRRHVLTERAHWRVREVHGAACQGGHSGWPGAFLAPPRDAGGMVPPLRRSGCLGLSPPRATQRVPGALLAATRSQRVPGACRRHVPTAGAGGLSPPRAHGGWCRGLSVAMFSQREDIKQWHGFTLKTIQGRDIESNGLELHAQRHHQPRELFDVTIDGKPFLFPANQHMFTNGVGPSAVSAFLMQLSSCNDLAAFTVTESLASGGAGAATGGVQ